MSSSFLATSQPPNIMQDQKHTPQPWHLDTYGEYQCISVDPVTPGDNGGISLAEFYGPDRKANAALFMRAPELQAENEGLKETLLEIDGIVIVPPVMSPQGRQLVIMCNMAKDALAGATPIGLQKEVNYLRGEIQRMRTKMKAEIEALKAGNDGLKKTLADWEKWIFANAQISEGEADFMRIEIEKFQKAGSE